MRKGDEVNRKEGRPTLNHTNPITQGPRRQSQALILFLKCGWASQSKKSSRNKNEWTSYGSNAPMKILLGSGPLQMKSLSSRPSGELFLESHNFSIQTSVRMRSLTTTSNVHKSLDKKRWTPQPAYPKVSISPFVLTLALRTLVDKKLEGFALKDLRTWTSHLARHIWIRSM